MRRFQHISAVLLAILSVPNGHAALTTFEYFDLSACTHGIVSEELSNTDAYDEKGAVQTKAKGRSVLESKPGCYGFCSWKEDRISCDRDSCPNFPLAGAAYKLVKDKGSLPSYRCISGCKSGVPKTIHDMGYEPEEGDRNLEREKMFSKFDRVCNEHKRR
jgi:hypothetical protein